MEDDLSVFMTDAWVEEAGTQNGAAYQGFAYFLKRARDGNMPLEKIIRKMSGATATASTLRKEAILNRAFSPTLPFSTTTISSSIPKSPT